MKTIYKLLYGSIIILSITSCEDFLSREPKGTISNSELFSSIEGVNYATVGIYSQFASSDYYSSILIPYSEFRSGNLKMSDSYTTAMYNKIGPSFEFRNAYDDDNDLVLSLYSNLYEIIRQSNNVIDAVDSHNYNEELLAKRYKGEALFFRAIAHFDLCRVFAQPYSYTSMGTHRGVVLMTSTMEVFTQVAPSKVYEVYDQVIEDLQNADTLLQSNSRTSGIKQAWVSSDAARALLARIFLYKKDWNNAIKYATLVIKQSYSLVPNSNLVDSWESTSTNNEDIFVADLSSSSSRSISTYFGNVDVETAVYGTVSRDLINLYDPADARLNLIIPFSENTKDSITIKYSSSGLIERYMSVIRLAEMYLTRAEASAEIGDPIQARSDLDEIRKRANPAATNITLSGQYLKDEIQVERRRELAFEGHTFYDFIRRGNGITRTDCNALVNQNVSYPSDLMIVPFPKDAVDLNPLLNQ
ncbi:MAG: RagB/SusD family nutrient uptake outer membrane protein [Bacteroidales bacterium]